MTARQTLVLSEDSWHVKVYRFWQKHGELKTAKNGYQENLCHYWRVVMFWAPINWFFDYQIAGVEWLLPFTITLFVAAIATITAFLVLATTATLFALAVVIGVAILFGLIIFTGLWAQDHPKQWKAIWRKILWSWAKYPCKTIAWLFLHLVVSPVEWYLNTIPWLLPAILGVISVALYVYYCIVATVLVGLVTLSMVIVGGIILFLANKQKRNAIKRAGTVIKEKKDPGIIKIGWETAVAKKHKICPFISFKD